MILLPPCCVAAFKPKGLLTCLVPGDPEVFVLQALVLALELLALAVLELSLELVLALGVLALEALALELVLALEVLALLEPALEVVLVLEVLVLEVLALEVVELVLEVLLCEQGP
jgi:hypothetical protein